MGKFTPQWRTAEYGISFKVEIFLFYPRIWIENADTWLAYITFIKGQEEQCKLDPKPQRLEYKKVAKPSFERKLNWENIYTVSLKKLATVCLQGTAEETREESKPPVPL